MSRDHLPLKGILIAIAFTLGTAAALHLARPAAVNQKKLQLLRGAFAAQSASLKLRNNLEVTVDLLNDYQVDQPFSLKATIRVKDNVNEPSRYRWQLGPEVSVVSGNLEGEIDSLSSDSPHEVFIILQKNTADAPAKAFFSVSYEQGGSIFGQTGNFSSRTQFRSIASKPRVPEQQKIPEGLKVIY